MAITSEYSSSNDLKSSIYKTAVLINRCILFIYLFEIIFKWIGRLFRSYFTIGEKVFALENFTTFWYSSVNVLEFILTIISLINLINEIYIEKKKSYKFRNKYKIS